MSKHEEKKLKIKDWGKRSWAPKNDWAPEQTSDDSPKKARTESPQISNSNASVPFKTTQTQKPYRFAWAIPRQKPSQHNVVLPLDPSYFSRGVKFVSLDRQSQQFLPKPNFDSNFDSNIVPKAKEEDIYFGGVERISVDALDSMKEIHSPKKVHEAFTGTIAQEHNEVAKHPPITHSVEEEKMNASKDSSLVSGSVVTEASVDKSAVNGMVADEEKVDAFKDSNLVSGNVATLRQRDMMRSVAKFVSCLSAAFAELDVSLSEYKD